MPSNYNNEHCLQGLDKNLHQQQPMAVRENTPSIVRDPKKGKAPADLFQNSKKNNGEFHVFIIFCYLIALL